MAARPEFELSWTIFSSRAPAALSTVSMRGSGQKSVREFRRSAPICGANDYVWVRVVCLITETYIGFEMAHCWKVQCRGCRRGNREHRNILVLVEPQLGNRSCECQWTIRGLDCHRGGFQVLIVCECTAYLHTILNPEFWGSRLQRAKRPKSRRGPDCLRRPPARCGWFAHTTLKNAACSDLRFSLVLALSSREKIWNDGEHRP